ncbi:TonB-dependent receptor domain-containing protein [Umezakia ovalisporum]|uniref:TonB-dependent receptor n=1 Tax=Umezakia ovalisporum FSS-43 TaxID=2740520 RepID=A0ABT6K4V5_9CYAN|nr:TonB-dependent receptor [Umezakia ovalisporum]MDH6057365.1 TonB-dependent receptor [Umezakia ovalisporum FSS-43]MDH6065983.1 TonB-dependent receptor [Umezakia ovalisporum APH033B]MDH6072495.1 TonB-dependent receptor [Umezakia ovalisporum CobakiLakeA]MDH6075560.1 TonB-dependent receptor [Umezakia ovalisporum CS-1034]MDH6081082.1 TonB-dependent receptor [Umezakia ovalisporum FSS-44]
MSKKLQLFTGLWLTGVVVTAKPVWGFTQLNQVKIPATTGKELISQNSTPQSIIIVNGVQANPTEKGVEVILKTTEGEKLQITNRSVDNSFIAEIPNAQLVLPSGDGFIFTSSGSVPGITEITVTNIDPNSIRVTVTGDEGLPKVELFDSNQGLIFSLTPVVTSPQKPQPEKTSQPPESPDENQESIELVVTATRTEENVQNISRSVTVIKREEIEQQAKLTTNLADILAKTVPGFGAPTNRSNTFGQSLRGRNISVLIDGVPQNANLQSIPAALTTIDPNAIQRIEVVRGPNAIYGGQATGGVVNIITKRPSGQRLTSTTNIGLDSSLTRSADSFGYNLSQEISGTEGVFDYTVGFSLATTGGFFDAQGDRIANFAGDEDSRKINALAKVGVELSPDQRLQFTFNHFDQKQDTNFISDEAIDEIPGIQKSRALKLPKGTTVISPSDGSFIKNTLFSLNYSNDNILDSKLQAQAYYRNYGFGGGIPTNNLNGRLRAITQSEGESEQLGGRLQVETPFNSQQTLSLLWGVDYQKERSSQRFNIFDPEEFEASGNRVFRKIDERTFVPEYDFRELGIFGQLQWDVSDSLRFSGGLRYVNIGVSLEDYTTAEFPRRDIQGGDRSFDSTVFNGGIVYKYTPHISVFANFAQGFSVPDLGRVFRRPPGGVVNILDSLQLTEPQKVDNYEIGIRGEWENIQGSLSGFYNYSDLGSSFNFNPDTDFLETVRAPQRIYGIEAAVDVQTAESWKLGGTATWIEGENDDDDNGEYLALNSITVPPLKLTAYIENQTLPGWQNRLQLLYSGNRHRGFNDEVEDGKISSFITVDYLSSIKVGEGELQVGIQNLFNNQYFPVYSQYFAPFFDSANYAGRGRTLSVGYRIFW